MVATLDRPSGTDMTPILEQEPVFSAESAQLLDQFDRSIKKRILNEIEERMRAEHRSQITDDDVVAAVLAVVERVTDELKAKLKSSK